MQGLEKARWMERLRLRSGPLASYLDEMTHRLERLGYAPSSIRAHLDVLANLGGVDGSARHGDRAPDGERGQPSS